MKRLVLVVDDDDGDSLMVCRMLRKCGFEAMQAASGRAGLAQAETHRPDLILLDIGLPDLDGIKVHQALRQNPRTRSIPVILLTGMDVLNSLLEAAVAGVGAEPVHRKDGGIKPLEERVRQKLIETPTTLRRGPLFVDIVAQEVSVDGLRLRALPWRRFALLCALGRREGPVSREQLLEEVWGKEADPKVVDVTIARLRRDLQPVVALEVRTTRYGYELAVILPGPR